MRVGGELASSGQDVLHHLCFNIPISLVRFFSTV